MHAQPFPDLPAGRQVGILQDQGKFVPAVAERGVRRPRMGRHLAADIPYDRVACDMAVLVVDLLEVVDIQQHQAEIGLTPAQPLPCEQVHGDFQQVIKMAPVVQSGQFIHQGEGPQLCVGPRDLFFGLHQLGDVMGDAPGANDLPIAAVQGVFAGGIGNGFPLRVDGLFDAVKQGAPGFHDLDFVLPARLRAGLRVQVSVAQADQLFLALPAKVRDVRAVVQDEPGRCILEIHRILHLVQQCVQDQRIAQARRRLMGFQMQIARAVRPPCLSV